MNSPGKPVVSQHHIIKYAGADIRNDGGPAPFISYLSRPRPVGFLSSCIHLSQALKPFRTYSHLGSRGGEMSGGTLRHFLFSLPFNLNYYVCHF